MANIYEGMFLLDNAVVREDWKKAKEIVTGTLEKHGATVHSARRWDERKLAYPISRRQRATYMLTYYEIDPQEIPALRRDFDLSEDVLRYLFLSAEGIPADEAELAAAENADDFEIPLPPPDDAPEEGEEDEDSEEGDAPAAEATTKEAPATEEPAAEAPAEEAPAEEAPAEEAPAEEAAAETAETEPAAPKTEA